MRIHDEWWPVRSDMLVHSSRIVHRFTSRVNKRILIGIFDVLPSRSLSPRWLESAVRVVIAGFQFEVLRGSSKFFYVLEDKAR